MVDSSSSFRIYAYNSYYFKQLCRFRRLMYFNFRDMLLCMSRISWAIHILIGKKYILYHTSWQDISYYVLELYLMWDNALDTAASLHVYDMHGVIVSLGMDDWVQQTSR